MNPFDPYPWVQGERISELAGRVVVECRTNDVDGFLAKKVSHIIDHLESQAYILKYATEVAGVKGPKLHRLYVQENARLMVTDVDPGVQLDKTWQTLDHANKAAIRKDLQEQIRRMRNCTKSSIGCVNESGELDLTATFPDPCHPSLATSCTAFPTEFEFDAHKAAEVQKKDPAAAADLQNRIEKLSRGHTHKFVLTYGDLSPRNIHVKQVKEPSSGRLVWEISGILDWERSGFFPEYMEYALAKISIGHSHQWRIFLVGLLEEIGLSFSEDREKVEYIATDKF